MKMRTIALISMELMPQIPEKLISFQMSGRTFLNVMQGFLCLPRKNLVSFAFCFDILRVIRLYNSSKTSDMNESQLLELYDAPDLQKFAPKLPKLKSAFL